MGSGGLGCNIYEILVHGPPESLDGDPLKAVNYRDKQIVVIKAQNAGCCLFIQEELLIGVKISGYELYCMSRRRLSGPISQERRCIDANNEGMVERKILM